MLARIARRLHPRPQAQLQWRLGGRGASQFHDAATVQMTVNGMDEVAACTVTEKDGKLVISILPTVRLKRFSLAGAPWHAAEALFESMELAHDDVEAHLKSKGFTGSDIIKAIDFVEDETELPAAAHDRVVLLELLKILFAKVDNDHDGKISMAEFKKFASDYELSFDDDLHYNEVFLDYDKSRECELSFEEFKALLFKTRLLTLIDGNHNSMVSEFGVHRALQGIFWDHFFSKADSDKDGVVSRREVLEVLRAYGLGDADAAAKAFDTYDKNDDGNIDKEEFVSMMRSEGVVTTTKKEEKAESGSSCAIL